MKTTVRWMDRQTLPQIRTWIMHSPNPPSFPHQDMSHFPPQPLNEWADGLWPHGEGAWARSSRRGSSPRPAPASNEGRGKNAVSLKKTHTQWARLYCWVNPSSSWVCHFWLGKVLTKPSGSCFFQSLHTKQALFWAVLFPKQCALLNNLIWWQ
jgi:hypothetical protein